MRAATIQHEPGWHEIGMTSIGNNGTYWEISQYGTAYYSRARDGRGNGGST